MPVTSHNYGSGALKKSSFGSAAGDPQAARRECRITANATWMKAALDAPF